MRRHGYYEGFWRKPGGLDAAHPASKGFREAASEADAEARNVADYAGALERYRKTVTGPGGVADPGPELAQGSTVLAVGGAIVGALALGLGVWWVTS